MATANIGRSALRVFKHYKKHYDDIQNLFDMSGLDIPAGPASTSYDNGQLPDDLLALTNQADQSLSTLKQHTGNVDELAAIDMRQLQAKKPELCSALTNYRKDLDTLFSAIQAIRAKAPKPKRKAGGKARTQKF